LRGFGKLLLRFRRNLSGISVKIIILEDLIRLTSLSFRYRYLRVLNFLNKLCFHKWRDLQRRASWKRTIRVEIKLLKWLRIPLTYIYLWNLLFFIFSINIQIIIVRDIIFSIFSWFLKHILILTTIIISPSVIFLFYNITSCLWRISRFFYCAKSTMIFFNRTLSKKRSRKLIKKIRRYLHNIISFISNIYSYCFSVKIQ